MTDLINQPHFIVDPSWRRPVRGLMVFAGSPLKMFTLSEEGRHVAELLEIGLPLPAGHETLTNRLLDAGAIHPTHIVGSEQPFTLADVSIVIPAHVRNAKDASLLNTLVDTLANLSTTAATIIVVDDASPHAISDIAGARVVSLDQNKGPGAARNHGLQFVTTPFVAFIDVDVTLKNDAFADHWGSTPTSPDNWKQLTSGFGARPDLSFVAVASETPVGLLLTHRYPLDDELIGARQGWIDKLATSREWRGKGVARSLIAHAINAYRTENLTHAALGVDASSQTGANRLYEGLGFTLLRSTVTYSATLR